MKTNQRLHHGRGIPLFWQRARQSLALQRRRSKQLARGGKFWFRVTLTSPTVAGSASIVGSTISGSGRGRPVLLGLGGRFNSTQHNVRRGVKAEFTSLAALRNHFDHAKQNCGLSVRLQDENSRFFLELSLLIVRPALLAKLPDYRRKPRGLNSRMEVG